MTSHSSRPLLRALVLAVLAPLLATGFTLASSSSAEAAWTNETNIHHSKVQLCRAKTRTGWLVKLRLNNRQAKHAHYGTLFRERGKRTVSIKVRGNRGKFSRTKALVWKRGDRLTTMVSELNGVGAGGAAAFWRISRCGA